MVHFRWRSTPLALPVLLLLLMLAGLASTASAAPVPGGTLDPLTIPKYVQPLVIPPVMPTAGAADNYAIAVKQFKQQILPATDNAGTPTGLPPTTVWSYGNAADNVPAVAPSPASTFNYPALTVETTANTPVRVRWINGLVDNTNNFLPHLLPIDQTVMWANPAATGCMMPPANRTDCATDNAMSYTGPVPMSVHLHGAHVDPHSDGFALAWWLPAAANIPPGYVMKGSFFDDATGVNPGTLGYADFRYRNDQSATTLWFHDHVEGMTRTNVYAGPAGFWIIRGGTYDGAIDNVTAGKPAAVLPGPAPAAGDALLPLNTEGDALRNAIREIPVAIQDRSFNADGSLFYPASRAFFDGFPGPYTGSVPTSTDIAPILNTEAFFNTMVVNGGTWPRLKVAPALYRLRLLNGCGSRMLNLSLRNVADNTELPFYQIGAEQGFLRQVVRITTGFSTPLPGDGTIPAPVANGSSPLQALLMGNAERADVLVDFRGLANGTVIRMLNTGADMPFGGFPVPLLADDNTTGQVMQFVVDTTIPLTAIDNSATPPQNLVLNAEPALPAATATRNVSLNEETSAQVCNLVDPLGAPIVDINGVILYVNAFPAPIAGGGIAAACAALAIPAGAPAGASWVPVAPKSPKLGIVNITNPAAPFGIPLGMDDQTGVSPTVAVVMADNTTVQTITTTENPKFVNGVAPIEEWDIYNFTVDGHPIHLHQVAFEVLSRTPIPGALLPTPSAGVVQPTESGFKDTVIAYPGEITKIRAKFDIVGLYLWHCHIVEHEDNEMMRPFVVSASTVTNVALAAAPASPTTSGTVVAFTATPVGGTGPLQYEFRIRRTGSATWSNGQGYSNRRSWNWTAVAGSFDVQVNARSAGSTGPAEATATIAYSVTAPAVSSVLLDAAPGSPATPGTGVTFTATPTGGTAPIQYQFLIRRTGATAWSNGQGWSNRNTWAWTAVAGSFDVQVNARSAGSAAAEATATITYVVTVPAVTDVTLTPTPGSPTTPGTTVAFAAVPTGGTAPIYYQFLIRRTGSSTWSNGQGFSTRDTWNWTAVAGDFEIQVNARSTGSTSPAEASATVSYSVGP